MIAIGKFLITFEERPMFQEHWKEKGYSREDKHFYELDGVCEGDGAVKRSEIKRLMLGQGGM